MISGVNSDTDSEDVQGNDDMPQGGDNTDGMPQAGNSDAGGSQGGNDDGGAQGGNNDHSREEGGYHEPGTVYLNGVFVTMNSAFSTLFHDKTICGKTASRF